MKIILTILSLVCISANAATYYVANTGSDAASGTSSVLAWQTLAKALSVLVKKDSLLLRKGDTWNEKFFVPVDSVYFGSYATGNKPEITAFQTLTGFSNSGNIWTATATNAVAGLNAVLIDGTIRAKGRYPNSGYLPFVRGATTTTKIVGSLTGYPDYTGSEIVVKCANYIIDVSKIASQVADSFFLTSGVDALNFGAGYFIQNTPLVLDANYEWSYNSTNKSFSVYGSTLPSVKVSVFDTLVWVNKIGVTFDGINITGGNAYNILTKNAHSLTVTNCDVSNSGANAFMLFTSNNVKITNDTILNNLNSGINSDATLNSLCNNILIQNNYVKNTTLYAGMGYGSANNDGAIHIFGNNGIVINNRVDSSGYMGIRYAGKKFLVKNNYVNTYCFNKDDGGGIYTYIGTYYSADYSDSSIVRGNIIENGVGNNEGVFLVGVNPSAGIYMDNYARRQYIDSNTIYLSVIDGINLNQATEIDIHDNTIFYTLKASGGNSFESAVYISNTPSNARISRNLFYNSGRTSLAKNNTDALASNTIDSNHYVNPAMSFVLSGINNAATFGQWQSAGGYDVHGDTTLPVSVTSRTPILYSNPTVTPVTIALTGNYVDYYGNPYYGSVYLPPYGSKLLFTSSIQTPLHQPSQSGNYRFIGSLRFYQ